MGRFIILAVLLCTACPQSGSVQTPPDFFEPATYGEVEERGSPHNLQGIHPAEDFPWIDSGGKPIWFHPVSEDTNWTHWDAWPYRTNIEDPRSRPSAEERRDVWHIGGGLGLGSAFEFVQSFPEGEQNEVERDMWVAFGGPFAHEYLHVLQVPRGLSPEQEELRSLTYELEDGYLMRFVDGVASPLIAFVTRDGDSYVTSVPSHLRVLFEATRIEFPVTWVFPSHERAFPQIHVVACLPARLCDQGRHRYMSSGQHPLDPWLE